MARILVPFDGGSASEYALDVACCTAGSNGDEVHAVYVLRVPYQLPIGAEIPGERAHAERVFERAHAIAERYHACLVTVTVVAREIGAAIVEAAYGCDIIMIGPRPQRRLLGRLLFGRTLRYVMAHAPCQVLIGYEPAGPGAAVAAPRFDLLPRREQA